MKVDYAEVICGVIILFCILWLTLIVVDAVHQKNVCKEEGYKLAVGDGLPDVRDGFVLCQVMVYDADGFGVVKYVAVEEKEDEKRE